MSFGSVLVPTDTRQSCYRVSSKEVSEDSLSLTRSATVIVSTKDGKSPSDAHETAASIELARLALEEFPSAVQNPEPPSDSTVTDRYAFAFDIDGVLIRGGKAIPEAAEALKVLNGRNPYGIKMYVVPIF